MLIFTTAKASNSKGLWVSSHPRKWDNAKLSQRSHRLSFCESAMASHFYLSLISSNAIVYVLLVFQYGYSQFPTIETFYLLLLMAKEVFEVKTYVWYPYPWLLFQQKFAKGTAKIQSASVRYLTTIKILGAWEADPLN